MRKVVMLASMLAMVLLLAAPAFAQTTFEVSQEVEQFGVVENSVCSQVYNIGVQQFNAGNQTANATATANASGEEAVAVANANAVNVANAAFIGVDTTNVCLNNFRWHWWWF